MQNKATTVERRLAGSPAGCREAIVRWPAPKFIGMCEGALAAARPARKKASKKKAARGGRRS